MMLPSGNDAAQSLGIYFGNLILKQELKEKESSQIGLGLTCNIDGNIVEEDYPEDLPEEMKLEDNDKN